MSTTVNVQNVLEGVEATRVFSTGRSFLRLAERASGATENGGKTGIVTHMPSNLYDVLVKAV